MNVYTTDRIRNVVLLGHGGSGKTSLVEAMAYLAGLTTRMGTVADKNTISDFDKEETKRQFSIHTSVVAIPWKDNKINVLDTPGYFDFVGESKRQFPQRMQQLSLFPEKRGLRQEQDAPGKSVKKIIFHV